MLAKSALFTAKEAAAGFALGALIGFAIGVVLVHSRLLQRGFLPYIVASQTVPILAIAPMVVIWVNPKLPGPVQGWGAVAVIAAYLTFFPVAINTLRGLQSADARALELMRAYAASDWTMLWKLRVPASLPYVFSALKVAATASVVGAIVGELPSSITDGLGGAILNFNQYYSLEPRNLWATNLVAAAARHRLLPRGRRGREAARPPRAGARRMNEASVVSVHNVTKVFAQRERHGAARTSTSTLRARRVRLADRAVGLRQVDAAARDRRPRPAEPRRRSSSTARPPHQARLDRDYGIVFQDAVLFDWRTVGKNIALPLELLGWDRKRRAERRAGDARRSSS